MFPNPSLIPRFNVEFDLDDLRIAMRHSEKPTQAAITEIGKWWPGRIPLFPNSGRTALFVALRALNLAPDARIGVPLFTCEAVFEAIRQAGCRPVFLDLVPDSVTLDPDALATERPRLNGVLAIHTLGYPVNLMQITEIADDLPVIEDCAHAVGASFNGVVVGNQGTFSFFSFRSGKPLSVGRLGMLLAGSQRLSGLASTIIGAMARPSQLRHRLNCLKEVARSELYHRPWFGTISLPIGVQVDERMDLMEKTAFVPMRADGGLVQVLAGRLQHLDQRLERRREIAKRLRSSLPKGLEPATQTPQSEPSYFQFAIRFQDEKTRDRAKAALARRGVDSIAFYRDIPRIARAYGYRGDCPATEAACQTNLAVPCYETLTDRDVNRIASALSSLGG